MQAQKGALGEGAGCIGGFADLQMDITNSYHDANKAVLKNTAAPRLGAKKHRRVGFGAWCFKKTPNTTWWVVRTPPRRPRSLSRPRIELGIYKCKYQVTKAIFQSRTKKKVRSPQPPGQTT